MVAAIVVGLFIALLGWRAWLRYRLELRCMELRAADDQARREALADQSRQLTLRARALADAPSRFPSHNSSH